MIPADILADLLSAFNQLPFGIQMALIISIAMLLIMAFILALFILFSESVNRRFMNILDTCLSKRNRGNPPKRRRRR